MEPRLTKLSTRAHAKGHWMTILTRMGVEERYLDGKHHPCPGCGGKDRFRYTDYEHNGGFICNQCGSGSGFDLLMMVHGKSFATIALEVEKLLEREGLKPITDYEAFKPKPVDHKAMRELWEGAAAPWAHPVRHYLKSRGIELASWPDVLRYHETAEYSRMPPVLLPALLAKVVAPVKNEVKTVNIHRIFLKPDGSYERKLMRGTLPPGSAVRLFRCREILGVAEGIETALAAHLIFGIPVWACLNAQNLAKFIPPVGLEEIVIFGDNDASYTGQAAAFTLAREMTRLKLRVRVEIPAPVDTDWNNYLLEPKRNAELMEAAYRKFMKVNGKALVDAYMVGSEHP